MPKKNSSLVYCVMYMKHEAIGKYDDGWFMDVYGVYETMKEAYAVADKLNRVPGTAYIKPIPFGVQ